MRKGSKKGKENIVAIKIILVIDLVDLYGNLPPRTANSSKTVLLVFALLSSQSILAIVQFIRA